MIFITSSIVGLAVVGWSVSGALDMMQLNCVKKGFGYDGIFGLKSLSVYGGPIHKMGLDD